MFKICLKYDKTKKLTSFINDSKCFTSILVQSRSIRDKQKINYNRKNTLFLVWNKNTTYKYNLKIFSKTKKFWKIDFIKIPRNNQYSDKNCHPINLRWLN